MIRLNEERGVDSVSINSTKCGAFPRMRKAVSRCNGTPETELPQPPRIDSVDHETAGSAQHRIEQLESTGDVWVSRRWFQHQVPEQQKNQVQHPGVYPVQYDECNNGTPSLSAAPRQPNGGGAFNPSKTPQCTEANQSRAKEVDRTVTKMHCQNKIEELLSGNSTTGFEEQEGQEEKKRMQRPLTNPTITCCKCFNQHAILCDEESPHST